MIRIRTFLALAVAAMVAIAVPFVACDVLPYAIVKPHRVTRDEIAKSLPYRSPRDMGIPADGLVVTVQDSIRLKGWFIDADGEPRGTILVLHGIANCKEAMLPLADKLRRHSFQVVLIDLRAHGESEGEYCTYGFWEKQDIRTLIDTLSRRYETLTPLGVYGNSLGAAIAVQALAVEPRLTCGWIESPFATLREITSDYLTRKIILRWRGLSDGALAKAGRIADFEIDQVSPENSAQLVHQPVVVVHGRKDRHIAIEYGERVFRNLRSAAKEFYEIPAGDHFNLSTAGGKEYEERMLSFFDRHCRR